MTEVQVTVRKRGPHSGRVLVAIDLDAKRFWAKVRKAEGDDCWLWMPPYRNGGGYPMFGVQGWGGRPTNAARAAYAIAYGSIPAGVLIRHRCNNKSCVRPDHLLAGTQADNMRDRRTGDLEAQWQVICCIRREYAAGMPATRLAAFFGIGADHISDILRNARYVDEEYTFVKRTGLGARSLSTSEIADALRQWTTGTSIKALAKRFGCGYATMYDVLHAQQAA